MPNKMILVPNNGLSNLLSKALARYKDGSLMSESSRKHIAGELYHVVCEYIAFTNQGILDKDDLKPKPKRKKVLSLTPEEFKAKQKGKTKKKVTNKAEIVFKEPKKNLEQKPNIHVRTTETKRTVKLNEK